MDVTLGDLLIVALPVVVLGMVIWGLSQAFKPRDFGLSDAERYQRELAHRSAAHQAEQARIALAARARINAATRPSQNQQAQLDSNADQAARQHAAQEHAAREGRSPGGQAAAGHGGRPPAVLPNGQLSPDFARQLQSMARNGQKIQAIKLLRDYTRADLLSAKNYIDRL